VLSPHLVARFAVAGLVLLGVAAVAPRFREHARLIPAIGHAPGVAPHLAAAEPAVSASAAPEPRARPERILMIGDSMVQALLPRLADYSLENGHDLIPAVWLGSTSIAWASSSRLEQLLREHKPTVVLVVLGASELLNADIERVGTFAVRSILRKVGSVPLAWIGPPNWRPDTGINAVLARELGPGRFFRSADLSLPRERDGIHPSQQGGEAWAEQIAGWLGGASSLSIALRPPTRKATPPRARVFPTRAPERGAPGKVWP
jgi:lysophospholipase L1-like esterase